MAWVVDTCLLIDVASEDPAFARATGELLEARRANGLVACPVTIVELSPIFSGVWSDMEEFLRPTGVRSDETWTQSDTKAASIAWNAAAQRKRDGQDARRPVADILIGAFALRFDGLLTRNPDDFKNVFPTLNLLQP